MMKKKLSFFVLSFVISSFSAWAEGGYAANQKAFDAIGLQSAYEAGFTGNGSTVVVIDTGTHEGHSAFIEDDEDGNPYSKVVSDTSAGEFNTDGAFNKITWPTLPPEDEGYEEQLKNMRHGTHVAGIIAAGPSNGVMQGVAFNSRIAAYVMSKPLEDIFTSVGTVFPQAKIFNASWSYNDNPTDGEKALIAGYFSEDRLLVASAGNNHAENPSYPALLPKDRSEARGIISAGAFDPNVSRSSPLFFAGYSNMAGEAANWTITAPGTIYSATLDPSDHSNLEEFGSLSGTSMAAPVISGVAALVEEAFPFLSGKQIADVLLTTADNDFSGFSPYIVQHFDEESQYIIFTDVVVGEDEEGNPVYADPDDIAEEHDIDCTSETCFEKTYAQVYGRGILNAGKAVKGLGALDASRLTDVEYDPVANQYAYTVTVGSYVRDEEEYIPEFSNDIGEIPNPLHADASVGLIKAGTGELIMSGDNTYKGDTVVSAGKLTLKGSLSGAVKTEESGTFTLSGGTVNGKITNAGNFIMESGWTEDTFTNTGTLQAKGGTLGEVLTNTGTVSVSGASLSKAMVNSAGGIVNYYSGTLSGITNEGTVNNYGKFSSLNAVQGGTLINQAEGTMGSSFSVDDFTNRGRILLLSDGAGGIRSMTVSGDALLETGGFAVENTTYQRGEYILLTSGTLTVNGAFEEELRISENVKIAAFEDGNVLKGKVIYSEIGGSPSFNAEEGTVALIINELFINQDKNDFAGFYYYSEEMLRKKINELRDQIRPTDVASLPLTGHLTENISGRLASLRTPTANQGSLRERYTPSGNMYRGKYSRGRSGGDEKTNSKVWGQVVGGSGRFAPSKNTPRTAAHLKAGGVQFGADTEIGDNAFIGVTVGFAHSETHQNGDESKIKDWRAGLYYGFGIGPLSVDMTAIAGMQEYHSRRVTDIVGLKGASKAAYKGSSAEGSINIGYDLMTIPRPSYSFGVRPYVAADVSYIKQDAYREKGQNQNLLLAVSETDDTSVSAQTGLQFSYRWSDAQVTLDTGFRRLMSGGDPVASAYFITDATQTKFKSLTDSPDKNYLALGLSVESNISPYSRFALRADQKRSKNNVISLFSASWSYSF